MRTFFLFPVIALMLCSYPLRTKAQTGNLKADFLELKDINSLRYSVPCNYTIDFEVNKESGSQRDPVRTHRMISGIGLATTYVSTVVVDLFYDDGFRKYTLIPVVGPFITIGKIENNRDIYEYWPGTKGLLILSGVAQTAFATYFVVSLVRHPKNDKTKNLTFTTSLNTMSVRIRF